MKWDKAKTILIVFLIIINLFLLTYLIADNMHTAKIEGRVADTAIGLLNEHGITVDKKTITDASEQKKMRTVYVKNIISSYDEFAKKVLGDDAAFAEGNKYTSKNGSLSFRGDYFEAAAPEGGFLETSKTAGTDIEKMAKDILTSFGAEIKGSEWKITESEKGSKVRFEEKIDGFTVYGAVLTVELTEEGIKKVCGCWYNEQEGGDAVMELKSPSGALIEYMNDRKSNAAVTIKNIEAGYAALETMLYHESVLLTPVWAITEDSGAETYINAREN